MQNNHNVRAAQGSAKPLDRGEPLFTQWAMIPETVSSASLLQPGQSAPGFDLPDADMNTVSLQRFRNRRNVVLYFYPKDDTPGCTKEACSFRDELPKIKRKDAVVLGVSPDGAEAHRKFISKYVLNFPLLSDPEHKVAEAYGAWGEKVLYGKRSIGMIRKTFIIGKDGKIEYANHKVKAEGHGEAILKLL